MAAPEAVAAERQDDPVPDVEAELFDDEQLPTDPAAGSGIMQTYLRAVNGRLAKETTGKGEKVLVGMLNKGEWCLRASDARKVCEVLGFPKSGHLDTKLIDMLWLPVERNHSTLLLPSWAKTADYADTPERFTRPSSARCWRASRWRRT